MIAMEHRQARLLPRLAQTQAQALLHKRTKDAGAGQMRSRLMERWPLAAIGCFLVLTVAFGVPIEGLMIHARRDDLANHLVVYADMWTPGAAAIATCFIFRKPLSALRLAAPRARYAWLGYLLPLVAACVAYPILWITGLAPPQFAAFAAHAQKDLALGGGATLVMFWLVATNGVIKACASALGEELGWRGLLVPALSQRAAFWAVTLISGVIWGAWHLPLMLSLPDAPSPLSVLLFFAGIVPAAGIAAWLRLRSGSLWPAVLFHASHNALLQAFFDPLTVTTGRAGYFATEAGAGIAVMYVILLTVLLRCGGVPTRDPAGQDAKASRGLFSAALA